MSRLEYQGCAMGGVRRHHQPSDMAFRSDFVLPEQVFNPGNIGDFEAQRVEGHALAVHLR